MHLLTLSRMYDIFYKLYYESMTFFSFRRLFSIIYKEFIQMKRDRITFLMIVAIPLLQLILFGFAINSNPKHLPTAIVSSDNSTFTRSFIAALQNTDYFNIINNDASESEAANYLSRTIARFIINIPPNFTMSWINQSGQGNLLPPKLTAKK